jgi:hypothetical protein
MAACLYLTLGQQHAIVQKLDVCGKHTASDGAIFLALGRAPVERTCEWLSESVVLRLGKLPNSISGFLSEPLNR